MILSALVLFCCSNLSVDTPRTPEAPPAIESKTATTGEPAVELANSKPDAPLSKTTVASKSELENGAGGEAIAPGSEPMLSAPVKPATTESYETPRQRKIWYGLMAASHGAAAFDAWTTRRAISGGYGVEGDPLQRPFAHSGAIYVTTQVAPVIMDYLGHRMMRSGHPWIRKAWWIPQAASAGVSLGAGVHNYLVVP